MKNIELINHLNTKFVIPPQELIEPTKKINKKLKLAAFCSGGKDSMLAIYLALQQNHEISNLINLIGKNNLDSFHVYNKNIVQKISEELAIPLKQCIIDPKNFSLELDNIIAKLKLEGIEGLCFGYIATEGQKDYIANICNKYDLFLYDPLSHISPVEIMFSLLKYNFKVKIVSIDKNLIDKKWLGEIIDLNFIKYLLNHKEIDLCGENGEYHTVVLNCPLYKKSLEFRNKKIFDLNGNLYLINY